MALVFARADGRAGHGRGAGLPWRGRRLELGRGEGVPEGRLHPAEGTDRHARLELVGDGFTLEDEGGIAVPAREQVHVARVIVVVRSVAAAVFRVEAHLPPW